METPNSLMRRFFGGIGGAWRNAVTNKKKQRAGITKNHSRGQSKARRRMASASRRRNRR